MLAATKDKALHLSFSIEVRFGEAYGVHMPAARTILSVAVLTDAIARPTNLTASGFQSTPWSRPQVSVRLG